jgi:oxaloacetate decarboxylase (Na+ extruding) subunit gamma
MDNSIVAQGLELMLYGMGTVIVFLGLLVVITTAMSSIVNRYFPEAPVPAAVPSPGRKSGPVTQSDGEVVAAISAAIARHRSRNNRP